MHIREISTMVSDKSAREIMKRSKCLYRKVVDSDGDKTCKNAILTRTGNRQSGNATPGKLSFYQCNTHFWTLEFLVSGCNQ